jgi:hypothetical protein
MKTLNSLMTFSFSFLLITLYAISFTSCDKDDTPKPNEQELITTVKLTFTPSGGEPVSFTARDLDGDGGEPPVIADIQLADSTSYTLQVEFLDESDPLQTVDLTEEVSGESAEHLVCFSGTGSMAAPVASDQDSNGAPLGLVSGVSTGQAGTGTLQVSLKHEPDKQASDPCSTGETDAEVIFQVTIGG